MNNNCVCCCFSGVIQSYYRFGQQHKYIFVYRFEEHIRKRQTPKKQYDFRSPSRKERNNDIYSISPKRISVNGPFQTFVQGVLLYLSSDETHSRFSFVSLSPKPCCFIRKLTAMSQNTLFLIRKITVIAPNLMCSQGKCKQGARTLLFHRKTNEKLPYEK